MQREQDFHCGFRDKGIEREGQKFRKEPWPRGIVASVQDLDRGSGGTVDCVHQLTCLVSLF